MAQRGKQYNESRQKLNGDAANEFSDAVKGIIESSFAKFDETVDVAVRLGVDPRHADQMVRGSGATGRRRRTRPVLVGRRRSRHTLDRLRAQAHRVFCLPDPAARRQRPVTGIPPAGEPVALWPFY